MDHVTVKLLTAKGWILYLWKYITKGTASDSVGLKDIRASYQTNHSKEDDPVIPAGNFVRYIFWISYNSLLANGDILRNRPNHPQPKIPQLSVNIFVCWNNCFTSICLLLKPHQPLNQNFQKKTKESNVRRFRRGKLVNSQGAITILLGIAPVYRSQYYTCLPIKTKEREIRIFERLEHCRNNRSESSTSTTATNSNSTKNARGFPLLDLQAILPKVLSSIKKKCSAKNLVVDADKNDDDADEDADGQSKEPENHQGSIVPRDLSQVSRPNSEDSVRTRSFVKLTRHSRYYDMEGRIVRNDLAKKPSRTLWTTLHTAIRSRSTALRKCWRSSLWPNKIRFMQTELSLPSLLIAERTHWFIPSKSHKLRNS